MTPLPRRLLHAWMPQTAAPPAVEPSLGLDSLPPLPPEAPRRMGLDDIEQLLEAGSRRDYGPMREAEVIETRPR